MHRPDPLKGQSPSAEKAQQGSLPPEKRHRECLLRGEGFGPPHPTPRQDQHLLPRLHPPRLRYPQHPTRQLPGQGRLTLSVDPRQCCPTLGRAAPPCGPGATRNTTRMCWPSISIRCTRVRMSSRLVSQSASSNRSRTRAADVSNLPMTSCSERSCSAASWSTMASVSSLATRRRRLASLGSNSALLITSSA